MMPDRSSKHWETQGDLEPQVGNCAKKKSETKGTSTGEDWKRIRVHYQTQQVENDSYPELSFQKD